MVFEMFIRSNPGHSRIENVLSQKSSFRFPENIIGRLDRGRLDEVGLDGLYRAVFAQTILRIFIIGIIILDVANIYVRPMFDRIPIYSLRFSRLDSGQKDPARCSSLASAAVLRKSEGPGAETVTRVRDNCVATTTRFPSDFATPRIRGPRPSGVMLCYY